MALLHPVRSALMLAMLGILSGCATGSSLSLSQAPLSFVLTEDGSYEIAAQNDGTAQALAESGNIEHGVPGYDVFGGNALLPVAAVMCAAPLTPVYGVSPLGPSLASVAAIPGQAAVNVDLAGQVQVAITSNASSIPLPGATAVTGPVTSILPPLATAPLASTVTVAANAPAAAAVTAPVVTAASQSLTAVSSVLGAAVPPSAPAASAPNNPILATLAAALGKRCC